jgi:hypothetical protein
MKFLELQCNESHMVSHWLLTPMERVFDARPVHVEFMVKVAIRQVFSSSSAFACITPPMLHTIFNLPTTDAIQDNLIR